MIAHFTPGTQQTDNIIENNTVYDTNSANSGGPPGLLLAGIALADLFTGSSGNYNNSIINNTVYNGTNYGISIDTASDDNVLTGNNASNNALDGLIIRDSSNNTVEESYLSNNSGNGITLSNSDNNTLADNSVSLNSNNGIEIDSSGNNSITLNSVISNGHFGVHLSNSQGNLLSGNLASNQTGVNGSSGFWSESSSNNTYVNDTACGNTQHGFFILTSDNSTFINNTACGNTFDGMQFLFSSSENTLFNNTAYGNNQNGFWFAAGAIGNNITGNAAYNNTVSGFQLTDLSANNTLAGNIAYLNAYGFALTLGFNLNTGTSNNTLTDDRAYSNDFGFYLNQANISELISDNASDNTFGIAIQNSTDPVLEYDRLYNNGWEVYQSSTSGNFEIINTTLGRVNGVEFSLSDVLTSGGYGINETVSPGMAPASAISFGGKYLKILFAPGESIDNLTFQWSPSEVTPYLEQSITAYTWNATGNSTWNLTSDQSPPSNLTHSLSITNLQNFTTDDIYGLFWNYTTPPSSGGGPSASSAYLVLIEQPVCPGNEANITVTSSSSGNHVPGATVTVGTYTGTTGSDGTVLLTMTSSGFFTMSATANGYSQGTGGFSFNLCSTPAAPPQCTVDQNCSAPQMCSSGQCVPVSCPNGMVVNHQCQILQNRTQPACNAPGCCKNDSACADNQQCL